MEVSPTKDEFPFDFLCDTSDSSLDAVAVAASGGRIFGESGPSLSPEIFSQTIQSSSFAAFSSSSSSHSLQNALLSYPASDGWISASPQECDDLLLQTDAAPSASPSVDVQPSVVSPSQSTSGIISSGSTQPQTSSGDSYVRQGNSVQRITAGFPNPPKLPSALVKAPVAKPEAKKKEGRGSGKRKLLEEALLLEEPHQKRSRNEAKQNRERARLTDCFLLNLQEMGLRGIFDTYYVEPRSFLNPLIRKGSFKKDETYQKVGDDLRKRLRDYLERNSTLTEPVTSSSSTMSSESESAQTPLFQHLVKAIASFQKEHSSADSALTPSTSDDHTTTDSTSSVSVEASTRSSSPLADGPQITDGPKTPIRNARVN